MEETGGTCMVSALAVAQYMPEANIVELPQEDIKWCTVALSEVLNTRKRLEASVFEVEGRHIRESIENCRWGTVALSDPEAGIISRAYYPGRFKRIYCSAENGVLFYLPSQMTDIYPKPEKYISPLTKCDISNLRVKYGDLLLTRSGTIGNVTVVSRTLENAVFSDDVIRITPKTPIDLGYLYTYFRSVYGNTILQTNKYGSVIQHIEPEHLLNIRVPNVPDEIKSKINNLIARSYDFRDTSNELIDQATAMLMEALSLSPLSELKQTQFNNKYKTNNYNIKLSELDGRLDCSYPVPIVQAITKHLSQYANEVLTVGDAQICKKIILPGRFKRVYVGEGQGYVFFSGKSIMELDPYDKKYLSFSQHECRNKEQLTIHKNMILVTCSGTIGKVAFVPQNWDGWAMTHDIIRFVPNEDLMGYLYIWLQSAYANCLISAKTYGSVVPHIEKTHIADVVVPLLADKYVQKKINNLAIEANELRFGAYKLEQEALRIMNEEVIMP